MPYPDLHTWLTALLASPVTKPRIYTGLFSTWESLSLMAMYDMVELLPLAHRTEEREESVLR